MWQLYTGRDVLATSQTGTGKTAAYLLPVLAALARKGAAPRPKNTAYPAAIVLAPTRELVQQVRLVLLVPCTCSTVVPAAPNPSMGMHQGSLHSGCVLHRTPNIALRCMCACVQLDGSAGPSGSTVRASLVLHLCTHQAMCSHPVHPQLCSQIEDVVKGLIKGTHLKVVGLHGGESMAESVLSLRRGPDVVVATPARLLGGRCGWCTPCWLVPVSLVIFPILVLVMPHAM